MAQSKPIQSHDWRRKMIQSHISSLYYVHSEAVADALPEIADIIKKAICQIDMWLKSPNSKTSHLELYDESLFHSLEFLLAITKLSPPKRAIAVENIYSYEDTKTKGDIGGLPRLKSAKVLPHPPNRMPTS